MQIRDEKLQPYFIKSDGTSYEVAMSTSWTNTSGKPVDKTISYHSNVESCLKKIVKLKVEQKEKVFDLKQYLTELKQVSEEIIKLD